MREYQNSWPFPRPVEVEVAALSEASSERRGAGGCAGSHNFFFGGKQSFMRTVSTHEGLFSPTRAWICVCM